jgi:hypothetical protein
VAFLLLRVPSLKSPADTFPCRLTYPGSLPSSRHHRSASTSSRRLPCLRFVPSSGFLNLSTASSALRLCGLVSSRSHVQGCRRSGASLPAQPCSLIRNPFPLAVVLPAARRSFAGCPLSRPTGPIGFHTREASASRLCSTRGRVVYGLGIRLAAARSPLRFFLLQVLDHRLGPSFPRAIRSRRFRPKLFASEFFTLRCARLRSVALSVFRRRARSPGLPRDRPARDFRAFRPKSPW